MNKQSITLGKWETELLSTLEHNKINEFYFEDAQQILTEVKRQGVRNILSRLAKKGRIERVKKGVYILVPFKQKLWIQHEFTIAPLLVDNYYLSFWSALKFWNLTEQLPRKVFVAVKKPVKPRTVQDLEFQFITLSSKYFFGAEEVEIEGKTVKIASREKTLLDCLLHPEHCGGIGEVAKALKFHWKEFKWQKVKKYLSQMNNSAVERRLLYCLKFLKLSQVAKILGEKDFKGFRSLDSSNPSQGSYSRKFGLRLNVDLNEELK